MASVAGSASVVVLDVDLFLVVVLDVVGFGADESGTQLEEVGSSNFSRKILRSLNSEALSWPFLKSS